MPNVPTVIPTTPSLVTARLISSTAAGTSWKGATPMALSRSGASLHMLEIQLL